MAKKITAYVKLQIEAGKATAAPPVGPALGQHGLNIAQFVKDFNAATQADAGMAIPVVITVYADHTFTFVTKKPPVASLLRRECKIKSGSGVPNKTKVATMTWDQCLELAKIKIVDTNAANLESCASMIAGTARSMGIVVNGKPDKE
ncbi:50S ribosomal protein L11 [Amygdalobacter indicium]|jgi:hypothetical protein|uniref:Large ribosomal subunit protein uL11 n=1 Tax=Amygdalobacter indicium TaxID=3029272 RepID=A0ABY8C7N1_9FIRM|nr:50S ribosomal protein L11 [Amygdalobacter indicium]WEG33973.1 50S ribosomal protein L11 [Amygdalobacter indicium]WEG35544.1 50S ribosomal protein L11 [Amygdalobacter indicium]